MVYIMKKLKGTFLILYTSILPRGEGGGLIQTPKGILAITSTRFGEY